MYCTIVKFKTAGRSALSTLAAGVVLSQEHSTIDINKLIKVDNNVAFRVEIALQLPNSLFLNNV